MKKIAFFSLLCVLLIACKEEANTAKDPIKTVQQYSIEQIMDNEQVSGGHFAPDNSKLLISSNRSGIYNMYTIPVNGGAYTPITQSDTVSVYAISFFPNDERILYRMDDNGDEIYHLYVKNTDGSSRELTPVKGARASFLGWTKDKKGFYLSIQRTRSSLYGFI